MIARFGGRVVRLGLRVDRGTFIFDISDISVVVISSVGHGLDTAIGKSNLVGSSNDFAVSRFLSVEVGTRVVILDSIGIGVRFWFIMGFGGFVCWSRFVGRGRNGFVSSNKSHEG